MTVIDQCVQRHGARGHSAVQKAGKLGKSEVKTNFVGRP